MSNTHLLGIVQPHYLHKVKEKNSGKKGLMEEATKCLFRTSLRSTHSINKNVLHC